MENPIVLVGNKCDSEKCEISFEEGKALADSFKLDYYETALNGDGVDIMF